MREVRRARTGWILPLLLVAVVQWPICALVLEIAEGFTTLLDPIVIVAIVIGAAACLGSVGKCFAAGGIVIGNVLLSAGTVAAFRDHSIFVPLSLLTVLWLIAALFLLADGYRKGTLLAMNIALLLLCVLLGEAGLAWLQRSEVRVVRGVKYRTDDPDLSSRLIPGVTSEHRVLAADGTEMFNVVYSVDHDGSRLMPHRPATGSRWACFGGSFCFGLGLNDEETIAARLQSARPDVRVFNYGIEAQGTGDASIYLRRVLQQHPETEVCVYFMIYDHFRRVACPDSLTASFGAPKPRFVLEDGSPKFLGKAGDTLSSFHKINVKLLRQSRIHSRLFGSWSTTVEVQELTASLIMGMKHVCDAAPLCRFLLVILPDNVQSELWRTAQMDEWKRSLADKGVQIHDLAQRFSVHLQRSVAQRDVFFYTEGHPNAAYARLIATWLDGLLKE